MLEAEQLGHRLLQTVWALVRTPQCESAFGLIRNSDRTVVLHGSTSETLGQHLDRGHMVCAFERIDVDRCAIFAQREVGRKADVRVHIVEDRRRCRCRFDVDDGIDRFDIGPYLLSSVSSLGLGFSNHHGNDVAYETNLALGQRWPGQVRWHHCEQRDCWQICVVRCVDPEHARHAYTIFDIDRVDRSVRDV